MFRVSYKITRVSPDITEKQFRRITLGLERGVREGCRIAQECIYKEAPVGVEGILSSKSLAIRGPKREGNVVTGVVFVHGKRLPAARALEAGSAMKWSKMPPYRRIYRWVAYKLGGKSVRELHRITQALRQRIFESGLIQNKFFTRGVEISKPLIKAAIHAEVTKAIRR